MTRKCQPESVKRSSPSPRVNVHTSSSVELTMKKDPRRTLFLRICTAMGVVAVIAVTNNGCSSSVTSQPLSAVRVTRAELGTNWPFHSVTAGLVGCDPQHPGAIIFTLSDGSGRAYALNGTALDAGYPQFPKSIWPQDGSTSLSALQALAPDNGCSD